MENTSKTAPPVKPQPPELVAHIAGALMAGGHFTAVAYAVKTAREIVAAAYSQEAA
jgi:hypothetical protein